MIAFSDGGGRVLLLWEDEMKTIACVVGVVVGLAVSAVATYRPQAQAVGQPVGQVVKARWGSLPEYPPSGGYCLDR